MQKNSGKRPINSSIMAIFDLSRKAAIPVFEEAIKEFRVLVDYYPHSKRAPQSSATDCLDLPDSVER